VFVQVIYWFYRAAAVVLVNYSRLVTKHLSWSFVLVEHVRGVLQGCAKAGLPQVLGSAPDTDLAVQTQPYRPCDSPPCRQYTLLYLKISVCSSVLSVLFTLKTDDHLENYSLSGKQMFVQECETHCSLRMGETCKHGIMNSVSCKSPEGIHRERFSPPSQKIIHQWVPSTQQLILEHKPYSTRQYQNPSF